MRPFMLRSCIIRFVRRNGSSAAFVKRQRSTREPRVANKAHPGTDRARFIKLYRSGAMHARDKAAARLRRASPPSFSLFYPGTHSRSAGCKSPALHFGADERSCRDAIDKGIVLLSDFTRRFRETRRSDVSGPPELASAAQLSAHRRCTLVKSRSSVRS